MFSFDFLCHVVHIIFIVRVTKKFHFEANAQIVRRLDFPCVNVITVLQVKHGAITVVLDKVGLAFEGNIGARFSPAVLLHAVAPCRGVFSAHLHVYECRRNE